VFELRILSIALLLIRQFDHYVKRFGFVKNALTTWSTAIASAGIAVLLAAVNPANAASLSFSASDGTRSSTPVNVDIFAKDVEDGVEVTLKVNDSNTRSTIPTILATC